MSDREVRYKKRQYKKKFSKVSKDKKQDKRIKSLEKFVYKTIENKQVNYGYNDLARSISTSGDQRSQFLSVATGAEDGFANNDGARIGNSITLMNQRVTLTFAQATTGDLYNRVRVLIVESTEGNQNLTMTDVLRFGSYASYGDLVFASPYTTKANTNKRYKVHLDQTFELNRNAKGATKIIKHNIKYKEDGSPGKLVTYADGTATYPNNHRLNIMCISDSSVAPHVIWNYNVRSTYKDA